MRSDATRAFALLDAILFTAAVSILAVTSMRVAIGAATLQHLIARAVGTVDIGYLSCSVRPDLHTANCRSQNNEELDVILPW
jgi:hypothetical protein